MLGVRGLIQLIVSQTMIQDLLNSSSCPFATHYDKQIAAAIYRGSYSKSCQ